MNNDKIEFHTLHAPYLNEIVKHRYERAGKPIPKVLGIPFGEIYSVDREKYIDFMKKAATVVMNMAWKERDNLEIRALGYEEDVSEKMMFRHTKPENVYALMRTLIVGDWYTDIDTCKVNRKKIEPLVKKYESFFPDIPVTMVKYMHGDYSKLEREVWFADENIHSFWDKFYFSGTPWHTFYAWLKDEIGKRAGNDIVAFKRSIDIDGEIIDDNSIRLIVTTQKVEKDAPWAKHGMCESYVYHYELVDDMDEYDSVPAAHLDYIIKAFAERGIEVKGVRLYAMEEH